MGMDDGLGDASASVRKLQNHRRESFRLICHVPCVLLLPCGTFRTESSGTTGGETWEAWSTSPAPAALKKPAFASQVLNPTLAPKVP